MENNDRLKNSIKLKIAISEFKKENMFMKNKNPITKIIVVACACFVLMSGIVFAKDIEKVIKNLFSNSSDAINQAVENGYVQTVEDDYVYDKDIGVKVDNLVLDELNLNVSFKFESKKENVKLLRCNKFIVSTDTGEKIYDSDQKYVTDIKDVYTASKIDWGVAPQKNEDNTFSDSLLFILGERSNPEKNILYFKIQSFDVTYEDDTKEEIYGEWNFDVKISDGMRQSQTVNYKLQAPNEHIESCKATLSPTDFKLELSLKEPLDMFEYRLRENQKRVGISAFYIKEDSKYIEASDISANNDYSMYELQYDSISIFSENTDKIEIYLEPWDETIILVKDTNQKANKNISYKLQATNEHIESCKATLHPTGLELRLTLKEPLDITAYLTENEDKVHGHMLFYYKENDEFIFPAQVDCDNKEYKINYDNISSLSKIPEKIEIYVDPFESSIFLVKD